LTGVAIAALALTGCSSDASDDNAADETTAEAEAPAAEGVEYPLTVTDMAGNEVTIESADAVVVTDNRAFGVLQEWGVEPVAAARAVMSSNNPWEADDSIVDTGSHREPDIESFVNVDPDLVITGYRYSGAEEDIRAAVPDAAVVVLDSESEDFYEVTTKQVELLGEIFGKQTEAEALIADLDAAIADAEGVYDSDKTVMGLIASGNEINYSSPVEGRGASDYFKLLGLTPALEQDGTSDHQGDEISIEAIAEAGGDYYLVLDRDGSFQEDGYTPAVDLIKSSPSLAEVPAVVNDAIYVMPDDYYLTEDIFAHTEVIEGLADLFQN
jgi:iron complex transport system substrate-binding protein